MAKRSKTSVLKVTTSLIEMKLTDQKGQEVKRSIQLGENICVTDCADGCKLTSLVHFAEPMLFDSNAQEERMIQSYAIDFGKKQPIDAIIFTVENKIEFKAILEKLSND